MSPYNPTSYRSGSRASRYVPDGYDCPTAISHADGDRLAPELPGSGASSDSQYSRPYTPPNPEQYDANPSYRVPLDNRPANPDVLAVQAAASHGGGRPRSSSSRSRAPSHVSHHSHSSHHSHDGRRDSLESHRSRKSRHSTTARSHHSLAARRSGEEPYRTDSEREEYIKGLKRIDSKRPTLGGSMMSIWDSIKKSLAK